MKRIARLVGGVFIVLLLSIALVSCDDALFQHVLQNGTQNEAQNGTQNNEQNEEQDESEEDEESEDEGDESEDEGDEFDGLPRKGDFTFTGTPPINHAAAVAASNEIKEEMERIKRELDQARENTETIEDIPEELLDMMGKAFGNVAVDYEEDGYAGMEVFSVTLVGVNVESDEENPLLKVDADSAEKFTFTRMFINESDQKYMETKVGMSAEFEIAGSGMEIDGNYKIELLQSVEGDVDDEEQETTLVGTLTSVDTNDNEELTEEDLLLDEHDWYEWTQEGAEPRQRIFTLFIELLVEFEEVPETLATQIFYPKITEDDTGEFFGLVSFYQEGDAVEEEVPLYLAPMYLSFLWKGADHEKYYVVYSSHEDYQTIVAINGVAYEFVLP
jgi:hypothetical protein